MIKDRQGHIVKELEGQNKLLKKLYSTSAGRCALKILVSPFVTHLGGLYMSSPFSKTSISSFIKNNDIDMSQYEEKKYKENIQNLKIKCSNLEQENNRVKKENGRLIRENEKTKQGKDTTVKEYNDRIIALSVENSKLKEKIRGKYKPKKNIVLSKTSGVSDPKVLCVTKNPADVLIKGYNIYFLTDLEELNKKIYTETVFDQIWYIRSGLTHADLIKVAEKYANQKILQARDWKALQKKLQGGDRL